MNRDTNYNDTPLHIIYLSLLGTAVSFLAEFERRKMFNFPILFQYLFLSILVTFIVFRFLKQNLENTDFRFVPSSTMKRMEVAWCRWG